MAGGLPSENQAEAVAEPSACRPSVKGIRSLAVPHRGQARPVIRSRPPGDLLAVGRIGEEVWVGRRTWQAVLERLIRPRPIVRQGLLVAGRTRVVAFAAAGRIGRIRE